MWGGAGSDLRGGTGSLAVGDCRANSLPSPRRNGMSNLLPPAVSRRVQGRHTCED